MNRLRVLVVLALTCCLVFSTVPPVLAAAWDMGSAGLPTITGSVGGSVTGTSTLLSNLVVTVNFGELSPINSNQIVKVVIPIALRSDSEYQMAVSRLGSVGIDPNSVQFSDIGIGIQNLRPYGNRAATCGVNSTIQSPFNNDPSSTFTINGATGRAQYSSSLANLGISTVVLNGPQLSENFGASGQNDGWAFDAILAVKPQYYTPGVVGVITLTFTISSGSAFPCT
ncbi:MAG: hypothetical protein AABN33_06575 [Acidobacteriota bacterium]